MLRLLLCAWLVAGSVPEAMARAAVARIARVTTPVATLDGVRVALDWPEGAAHGALRLQVDRLVAPSLGYRFRDLDWQCPLERAPRGGWRCAGALRGGGGAPFSLALSLDDARTVARLERGGAVVAVEREAATPALTRIDLARVPLAWTQALLAQAWPEGRLTGGTGDARLRVGARDDGTVTVDGPLALHAAAFDTPSGTVAAEGLDASLDLGLVFGARDRIRVAGQLHGGELLFGKAYLALSGRTVDLALQAVERAPGGWDLPALHWRDPGVLEADGSAVLGPAGLQDLRVRMSAPDLAPLRDAYLSGFLGAAGLGDLALTGSATGELDMHDGAPRQVTLALHDASVADPGGRFALSGLEGDVRFSADASVDSALQWRSGALYGLALGPARLPFTSEAGSLHARGDIVLPLLGGEAVIERLAIRPPNGTGGLDVRFGLALRALDISKLATTMGWPAFEGSLAGHIPQAHYAAERLAFDGGLAVELFGGRVAVSSLAMERPFGVAPTLSADIALDDLDLEALTGVFGFGSITGRLDGRIAGLRLVDWQPVAFDARLETDPRAARRLRTPQRISQRAVQDLSSVGDSSLVGSLQAQLIGLFDDFGYARIGIGCRLVDEVCTMAGLGSAGPGFIIVEGRGLPRLQVVGFNRRVDWPTLVERLAAVGSGDVKPVVD